MAKAEQRKSASRYASVVEALRPIWRGKPSLAMGSSIYITYTQAPDLTPEQARYIRARALRYALDCYFEKQKAAKTSDGKEGKLDLHSVGDEDA